MGKYIIGGPHRTIMVLRGPCSISFPGARVFRPDLRGYGGPGTRSGRVSGGDPDRQGGRCSRAGAFLLRPQPLVLSPHISKFPVILYSQKGCKFPCAGFPQRFQQTVENYADFSTITGCIFPKPRISVENSVESVENPIFWGGFFHTRFHENCRSITFC